MVQNFVLAFGGTSCRCVEALAYLCASRAVSEPTHVLVIDPDEANGNRRVALDQLQRYSRIHSRIRKGSNGSSFFAAPLNPGASELSFAWGHPATQTSFKDLIGYGGLEGPERHLIEILYDNSDLDMAFDQGYVGRAHVGSLDTYRTLRKALHVAAREAATEDKSAAPGAENDPLRTFFREIRKAVDGKGSANLVVLGSVFGGTGASGLPVVPRVVRDALGQIGEKVNTACVQMAPYFVFPEPANEGDPDSTHHPLATQAALYHYARTGADYDRIYLLGAPERMSTAEANYRGGRGQRNAAHYAEFAAALATIDFFHTSRERGTDRDIYACGATEVRWPTLPSPQELQLRHRMAAFTTFCLLHDHYIHDDLARGRMKGAKWWVDLNLQLGAPLAPTDKELVALKDFTSRYLQWAGEVDTSADRSLFTLPTNKQDTSGLAAIVDGGDGRADPFHDLYRLLDRGGRFNQPTAVGWYLEAATVAVDDFCAANYDWWRA